MQKNSRCTETEQSYLCRVLNFNRQNLMLISLPKDCRLQLTEFIENIPLNLKNSMRCVKQFF